MSTKATVVAELRSMFRCGATPSRLIRHIVNSHPEEQNWHALIQDYFREAFDVGIVRNLDVNDDYSRADLRHAFLNKEILHEMVQYCENWLPEGSERGDRDWLDGLSATSYEDRINQVAVTPWDELSANWDKLTAREKDAINRVLAGIRGQSELIQILSRLVERLQQRVDQFERAPMVVEDSLSSDVSNA